MQMARSCWYSARLRKKPSMGRGMPGRATAAPRCRTPRFIVSNAFGGMMCTCSAWTGAPSCACSTGMGVCRPSNSGRWLTWVGSRCGITTKPRPFWAGMALKNLFNASSPPAEAPIATTGKSLGWPSPASSASGDASAAGRGAGIPPLASAGLADCFFPRLVAMHDLGSVSYPRRPSASSLRATDPSGRREGRCRLCPPAIIRARVMPRTVRGAVVSELGTQTRCRHRPRPRRCRPAKGLRRLWPFCLRAIGQSAWRPLRRRWPAASGPRRNRMYAWPPHALP